MLTDAFCDCQDRLRIRYRTDGGLFYLRCLKAVCKVKETIAREVLFADDCALNPSTEQKMQQEIDCFSRACDNFGLPISTKKTEVMYQPVPGQPYQDPHITERRQERRPVDSFTYLGCTLSRAVYIDIEINNRIAKASYTFRKLCETVWEWRGLSLIKLKVYRVVVLTTLLYTCETWTVYSRHAKQLNSIELPP